MGPPFGWDPTTATLIYGERDAVLVDALTTRAEGEALANWIALHDKNLTTIYDALHSTSLHVPSIDLVVGGDVLYNQCHMVVGETTPKSRENWIAALDRLAALKPRSRVMLADEVVGAWERCRTGAPELAQHHPDSRGHLGRRSAYVGGRGHIAERAQPIRPHLETR